MPDIAIAADDGAPIVIEPSVPADAADLLALQRRCYRSEAALYDDWTIPPLTQTLAESIAEYNTHRILAARAGPRLVGSVRACEYGGVVEICRLVVAPALQRRGIGSALMAAIEGRFPAPTEFELFTGHLSISNLRLYVRLGYVEHRRVRTSERIDLVYLRKRVEAGAEMFRNLPSARVRAILSHETPAPIETSAPPQRRESDRA